MPSLLTVQTGTFRTIVVPLQQPRRVFGVHEGAAGTGVVLACGAPGGLRRSPRFCDCAF